MSSTSLSRLFRASGRLAGRPTAAVATSSSSSSAAAVPRHGRNPRRRAPFDPAGFRNRAVEDLIDALFKEPDLDRLVSCFKEASASRRFRSKHRVYEFAVRRLADAGRLDAVVDILEAQKQYSDVMAREGFAARIIVLYGRAGMVAAAEETFRQLPTFGCRRTVLSFNALLTACSDAGNFQRMDEIFRTVPAENVEIVPDDVSYNILIGSMCKRNDLDAAMRMLEIMEERGAMPDLITFNTLLNGCYANGHFSDAEMIWNKMAEKDCEPDVKSFNAKLRGLALAGRTSEAAELVGQLPSMGLKPDTYSFNALIKGHCREGNLAEAKMVFEDLTKNDCRPNRETFETLVPCLCHTGQLDLALRMCNESMSRKCYVAAEVLQRMVDELFKNSRADDASELVQLALSNHYGSISMR